MGQKCFLVSELHAERRECPKAAWRKGLNKEAIRTGRRGQDAGTVPDVRPSLLEFQYRVLWALNSAVECHLHTVEVIGSNPIAPTTIPPDTSEEQSHLGHCSYGNAGTGMIDP